MLSQILDYRKDIFMARTKSESKLDFFTKLIKPELGKLYIEWLFGEHQEPTAGAIKVTEADIEDMFHTDVLRIPKETSHIFVKNDKDCLVLNFNKFTPSKDPNAKIGGYFSGNVSILIDKDGYVYAPWIV